MLTNGTEASTSSVQVDWKQLLDQCRSTPVKSDTRYMYRDLIYRHATTATTHPNTICAGTVHRTLSCYVRPVQNGVTVCDDKSFQHRYK